MADYTPHLASRTFVVGERITIADIL